jgi:hypothetical protein
LQGYLGSLIFRYNNRIALAVDDEKRANELAKGIVGKRLTYRRPNSKTFTLKALRFLRWRQRKASKRKS